MKQLAGFCRRVGISVNAGLSLVEAVKREASRQKNPRMWMAVADSMAAGSSFTEALRPFQEHLGEMFVALIQVGEESGHLGEMLIELADYYDQMLQIRRDFQKSLIWPVMELVIAIAIIGILILALGVIRSFTGTEIDVLGFGLVGVSGFIKYVVFLAVVGAVGYGAWRFMKRSVDRSRPVHDFLLRIPKIGRLFQALALMKLTWALHLTLRTGMDIRRALRLSFETITFTPIRDNLPIVLEVIERGGSLTEAFLAGRHLDNDFLSAIDSGEQSGNTPELMQRLTTQYLQESLLNLRVVSILGGFVVYGMIAFCIIVMIVRIFLFYLGILDDALKGI